MVIIDRLTIVEQMRLCFQGSRQIGGVSDLGLTLVSSEGEHCLTLVSPVDPNQDQVGEAIQRIGPSREPEFWLPVRGLGWGTG